MRSIARLSNDEQGSAISVELVLIAVVALVGMTAGLASVRDAVVSEFSDIAGGVQDSNQSYLVNGILSHSSSVAGMDFLDATDHCDDADDSVGAADNCIVMSTPPTNENSGFVSVVFGNATDSPAPSLDGWRSTLVIDRVETFTSTATNPISVIAETFNFYAGQINGIVTPFIVSVLGGTNFEVVAIGDTVPVTAVGQQSHAFSASPTTINVDPGETLAFGFLNSNPDGSGTNGSVIRFGSGNSIWFTGGPADNQSGSVAIGSAPTPGLSVLNLSRDYQFSIGLGVPQ